jgi:hypothetical protein
MTGLFRQSTFGRLGGYGDVSDADRLGRDPAMRWIVGGRAVDKQAASATQMGRFETEFLPTDDNLAALADLSGDWIDRVHGRRPPKRVLLDMDSSVSPTYGDQEATAYNGCTCYHPLFLFNHMGDLERCRLRPGNVHSADGWRDVLVSVVERYKERQVRLQLHALAYNLAKFIRNLALPREVEDWSLTAVREKLVKIGAKVVSHGRYVTFQMAEVAVTCGLFQDILRLIDGLRRPSPAVG